MSQKRNNVIPFPLEKQPIPVVQKQPIPASNNAVPQRRKDYVIPMDAQEWKAYQDATHAECKSHGWRAHPYFDLPLEAGRKVRHPKHGEGVVKESSLNHPYVSIYFKDAGRNYSLSMRAGVKLLELL